MNDPIHNRFVCLFHGSGEYIKMHFILFITLLLKKVISLDGMQSYFCFSAICFSSIKAVKSSFLMSRLSFVFSLKDIGLFWQYEKGMGMYYP